MATERALSDVDEEVQFLRRRVNGIDSKIEDLKFSMIVVGILTAITYFGMINLQSRKQDINLVLPLPPQQ